MRIVPSGQGLGAAVVGLDLRSAMTDDQFVAVLAALGDHGVLCFPDQKIGAAELAAFSGRFGSLEIHVASGPFREPDYPQVMSLSNIRRDGQPIGLPDAGQDWHTDMSYSDPKGFAVVLHARIIPRRGGVALGDTLFADMAAAYDDLPQDVVERLRGVTATHDYAKFWDEMRRRGSPRPPLTDEQRRKKPPVSQPILLRHPVSGRMLLYADPGYTVKIDGWPQDEGEKMLAYLFQHQLNPKYRYAHHWSENDLVIIDNLRTLHHAVADYGPDEPRLMKRCQVVADRVFDPAFATQTQGAPA